MVVCERVTKGSERWKRATNDEKYRLLLYSLNALPRLCDGMMSRTPGEATERKGESNEGV